MSVFDQGQEAGRVMLSPLYVLITPQVGGDAGGGGPGREQRQDRPARHAVHLERGVRELVMSTH